MSQLRFTAAFLAIAALAGWTHVQAQQTSPGIQQQRPEQTDQRPEQTDQRDSQPTGSQTDRYEARRATTDASQPGKSLKAAIAQKLTLANDAEIELAKMAQQKVDHPELKQLTQTLIQDHQKLNQQLQQFTGQDHAGQDRAGQARAGQDRAGQARAGQARAGQARAGQASAGTSPGQATAQRGDQRQGSDLAQHDAGASSVMVPAEMCQLMEQAHQNRLEMTKEMLSNYEDQDFQMAFLGQQVFSHTSLIADLKAIESHGPDELQSYAQQALPMVEQHRDQAKQLAKKLKDNHEHRTQR